MFPSIALLLLVISEPAMRWARRSSDLGRPERLRLGLLLAAASGLGFVIVHAAALAMVVARPQSGAYASAVWMLAGFHAVHVLVGVLVAAFVWLRSRRGHIDAQRRLQPRIAAALWRYVVAQVVVTWAVLHLFPRLLA